MKNNFFPFPKWQSRELTCNHGYKVQESSNYLSSISRTDVLSKLVSFMSIPIQIIPDVYVSVTGNYHIGQRHCKFGGKKWRCRQAFKWQVIKFDSNVITFIGYINDAGIKFSKYFNSRMRIIDIIYKWFHVLMQDRGAYEYWNVWVVSLHIHFSWQNTKDDHLSTMIFANIRLLLT
jgi:hypothetical protein